MYVLIYHGMQYNTFIVIQSIAPLKAFYTSSPADLFVPTPSHQLDSSKHSDSICSYILLYPQMLLLPFLLLLFSKYLTDLNIWRTHCAIMLVLPAGIRDFFKDTKVYLKVTTDLWGGRNLDSFSRVELDNYRQVGWSHTMQWMHLYLPIVV